MALFEFYSWGSNQHGQIAGQQGDGHPEFIDQPTVVHLDLPGSAHSDVCAVLCGAGHSGILTKTARLYLWGWNDEGQCATADGCAVTMLEGTFTSDAAKRTSQQVLAIDGITAAALGHSSTLLLEADEGRICMLGSFPRGSRDRIVPMPKDMKKITRIAIGLKHAAAVREDGLLYTWGDNCFGQCLSTEGYWRPPTGATVVTAACGARNTIVVDSFGQIYSAGSGRYGTLGRLDDSVPLGVVEVEIGCSETLFFHSVSMGENYRKVKNI